MINLIDNLVYTTHGQVSGGMCKLRDTDRVIECNYYSGTQLENLLADKFKREFVIISNIWFFDNLGEQHTNPIVIRGINTRGSQIDYVLCCPTLEVMTMLYNSAYVGSNARLAEIIYRRIQNLYTEKPKAETVPDRIIVRCFEK